MDEAQADPVEQVGTSSSATETCVQLSALDSSAGNPSDQITSQAGAADDEYLRQLALAQNEDFSDLDQNGFLELRGWDAAGHPLFIVLGKCLPASVIDPHRLQRYVYLRLDPVASSSEFAIVYFHTDTQAENSPGVLRLKSLYESFPASRRRNLSAVYVVHPSLGMRMKAWAVGQWASEGFYNKVVYVSRLEFLEDYIPRSALTFPEYVVEHDKELEDRPLMDYGIEATPPELMPSPEGAPI